MARSRKLTDTGAGAEARRLRLAAGLTLAEVAERAKIAPNYLSMIERGERPGWNPDLLFALSEALGVDCSHWKPFFAGLSTVRPPDEEAAGELPSKLRGRPKKQPPAGE